jgi:hypothetical protein
LDAITTTANHPHQMKHELRINNYVLYDNRYFQIYSISDEFPLLNTAEFGIGVVDWNNIHPIPITEELLVKCPQFNIEKCSSWSTGKEVKYNVYRLDRFTYNSIQDNWYYANSIIEIKYIHKLQNCIQDFANTELTIEI